MNMLIDPSSEHLAFPTTSEISHKHSVYVLVFKKIKTKELGSSEGYTLL